MERESIEPGRYEVIEGVYGPQETPMWEFSTKLTYHAPGAEDGTYAIMYIVDVECDLDDPT